MRTTRVWRRLLGVEHTVIESVSLEPDGRGGEQLIARVRPKAGVAARCSRCGRRAPGYDISDRPRRWRGLDLGTTAVFLQATTRGGVLSRAWGRGCGGPRLDDPEGPYSWLMPL